MLRTSMLLVAACGAAAAPVGIVPPIEPVSTVTDDVGPDGAPPAAGRLPGDVMPRRYALDLTIDPRLESFEGEVAIRARLSAPRRVIYMHGAGLDVRLARVSVLPAERGGEAEVLEASWRNQDDDDSFAALTLPRAVSGEVEIRIRYSAPFNRALNGLYRVEHAGESYAFTQMEPLSARKAFPGFDEPAFKTPFDVTLRVAPEHVAAANSAVREERTEDGLKVVRFESTEPIPTYLFALAVGPLDVVVAEPIAPSAHRLRPLPFRGLAPRGRGPELAYAMQHTPAILASLEAYFEMAYPYDKLDIVAVPDFEAGAMENVGLITFRDSILLLDEATAPTNRIHGLAYIMAHELAHQWFGNLVTMVWWDDLWLNEAFASWVEHRAVEAWRPQYEPDLDLARWVYDVMAEDSLDAARSIAQPIVSSHDIHNAFDGITYGKGAGVIAMFERWMGRDVFRRAVRSYLLTRRFASATSEELLSAMSEAAGRDVAAPFRTFLSQPGVPHLDASLVCDEGGARIALRQSRYAPVGSRIERDRAWVVPVCARYSQGRGRTATTQQICGLLEERDGALAIEGACPAWVHPNADGAGYYRWSLPPQQLAALRGGLGALSVAERLSLADSLAASFASGTIEGGAALDALLALANDPHHQVATASLGLFDHVLTNVVDEAHAPKLRQRLVRAYQRDYRALGWKPRSADDEAARLRRGKVVGFLATVALDPAARREGSRLGVEYLGESEVDPTAVATDLAEAALTVAVQSDDVTVFERAVERLRATTDGAVRRTLLRALGSVTAPALSERALALALDPELRVNELYLPLTMQARDPRTRPTLWRWLAASFDTLVARLPPAYAGYLPQLMSGACSVETADEVEAFFGERVRALPGGPRNLQSAVEAIRLCAEQAEAQRAHVHAWLD